jgi:hypothetical protein
MVTKKCASCQIEKSELYFRKRKNGGLHSYCFDCSKAKARKWNEANRERKKANDRKHKRGLGENRRWNTLKYKYGITKNDYEKMLNEQNGKCKICGVEDSQTKISNHLLVDHCHTTNDVRGLLCHHCNIFVGLLEMNPDIVYNALKYLKR